MKYKLGLSNAQRKALLKSIPVAARHEVGEKAIKVARIKAPICDADRDGLQWLIEKRRITPSQHRAALSYRTAFRETDGATISSCLGALDRVDTSAVGFGYIMASHVTAQRTLFVLRYHVLLGQSDMLTVMDGVVGVGHTLRYLAGGDGHRAKALELILRVSLDLLHAHGLTNVHEITHQKPRLRITSACH